MLEGRVVPGRINEWDVYLNQDFRPEYYDKNVTNLAPLSKQVKFLQKHIGKDMRVEVIENDDTMTIVYTVKK